MSVDRIALCAWLSELAAILVKDEDDAAAFRTRAAAAPAMDASDFAAESLSLMRVLGESVASPSDFDTIKNGSFTSVDTVNASKILLAVGLALAGGRAEWISRPQARAGRDRISEALISALEVVSSIGAEAAGLYGWISNLAQTSMRLISDIAADLVPVVWVETGISLPSTVLAHKLYGDASRAGSLVDIAGSSTPMLMPVGFDALEG